MKKERPILFNGEMVRAILDGRKTQTRRIVKPQPTRFNGLAGGKWIGWPIDDNGALVQSPFGGPGDRLWVRETFALENTYEYHGSHDAPADGRPIQKHEDDYGSHWLIPRYKSTEPDTLLLIKETEHPEDAMRWTPSIHMPRWASRITLEATDVRVERLQDISEEDAMAEGMFFTDYGRFCFHENKPLRETSCRAPNDTHPLLEGWNWKLTTSHRECLGTARSAFINLWESVYKNWNENPWVWVVEFRRLEAQEKAA